MLYCENVNKACVLIAVILSFEIQVQVAVIYFFFLSEYLYTEENNVNSFYYSFIVRQ